MAQPGGAPARRRRNDRLRHQRRRPFGRRNARRPFRNSRRLGRIPTRRGRAGPRRKPFARELRRGRHGRGFRPVRAGFGGDRRLERLPGGGRRPAPSARAPGDPRSLFAPHTQDDRLGGGHGGRRRLGHRGCGRHELDKARAAARFGRSGCGRASRGRRV